jgi:hypothetical protein
MVVLALVGVMMLYPRQRLPASQMTHSNSRRLQIRPDNLQSQHSLPAFTLKVVTNDARSYASHSLS